MVDSARRRGVTDVSLSRRVASTQCFRRRRATSACSARRTLAAYLSSAVCGAVLAEPHARRPMNPLGLPRKCHGSLSEVPPSGPNPREVDLPQLSPWTLACVRDTQHLRQHKLIAAAPPPVHRPNAGWPRGQSKRTDWCRTSSRSRHLRARRDGEIRALGQFASTSYDDYQHRTERSPN